MADYIGSAGADCIAQLVLSPARRDPGCDHASFSRRRGRDRPPHRCATVARAASRTPPPRLRFEPASPFRPRHRETPADGVQRWLRCDEPSRGARAGIPVRPGENPGGPGRGLAYEDRRARPAPPPSSDRRRWRRSTAASDHDRRRRASRETLPLSVHRPRPARRSSSRRSPAPLRRVRRSARSSPRDR